MSYRLKYRLRGEEQDAAKTEGEPFDTFRDGIDERNWFFGHSPGVIEAYLENDKGVRSGARLQRA